MPIAAKAHRKTGMIACLTAPLSAKLSKPAKTGDHTSVSTEDHCAAFCVSATRSAERSSRRRDWSQFVFALAVTSADDRERRAADANLLRDIAAETDASRARVARRS